MIKKLTREKYQEKFNKLFTETYNYIPQEGERIIQCKEGYPDYWFISNKGYLFSICGRGVKIVKPNFDRTGTISKSGKRNGRSWRYSTRSEGKSLARYEMGRMVAEHFCENEFNSNEKTQVHHKRKRNSFYEDNPQKCNSADNLQLLPTSKHTELTSFSTKPIENYDRKTEEKIKKSKCPVVLLTQEQMESFLLKALQNSLDQGLEPTIYITSITDDEKKIEAEAHPIKMI